MINCSKRKLNNQGKRQWASLEIKTQLSFISKRAENLSLNSKEVIQILDELVHKGLEISPSKKQISVIKDTISEINNDGMPMLILSFIVKEGQSILQMRMDTGNIFENISGAEQIFQQSRRSTK